MRYDISRAVMRVSRAITVMLFAALVPVAERASPQAMPSAPAMEAFRALDRGEYLKASALMHGEVVDGNCAVRDHDAFFNWAQIETLIAGVPPGDPAAASAWRVTDAELATLHAATGRDALNEIARRARDTRIVILNEDHAVPRSRAFALQVARRLRPLGYDVLAMEALTNDDDPQVALQMMQRLQHDGFVRRNTGIYTADPVFADFIRRSLALGYRPVAYESHGRGSRPADEAGRIAAREQGEAENVIRNALDRYPHSKILIHVGFGHVAEEPVQRDGMTAPWMAARLKKMTGIDPLTIDQTTLLETPTVKPDRPVYPVVAATAGQRSVVLMAGARPVVVGRFAGAVDLQVVHPRATDVAGRAGWLVTLGRHPVGAPAALRPAVGTILVQAFRQSEGADAIPVDQVRWTTGRPPPTLMLPREKLRFAVQTMPPSPCEIRQPG